jgi:hypothetical protein
MTMAAQVDGSLSPIQGQMGIYLAGRRSGLWGFRVYSGLGVDVRFSRRSGGADGRLSGR